MSVLRLYAAIRGYLHGVPSRCGVSGPRACPDCAIGSEESGWNGGKVEGAGREIGSFFLDLSGIDSIVLG
jgi:hypothetical protein